MSQKPPAILVLENGSVYEGYSFGHQSKKMGEVCFNTSMSGYQEILTDPSYHGQIITLTYPMIGNYGIDPEVNESSKIQAQGLIVKEYVDYPSNFTSKMTLAEFLKEYEIPGIQGLDTRKLVLELRTQGAMRGGIFCSGENAGKYDPAMLEEVRQIPSMAGSDFASVVTADKKYAYGAPEGKKFKVAVLDFGVKTNILRMLDAAGFAVDVYPAKTTSEELFSGAYDCYFLSNGPGDPEPLDYAINTARALIEEGKPIFGICLGHQILGLAGGRSSYKLKFGHRGGNQPVKDLISGQVEITAQNHGFCIEDQEGTSAKLSHVNLNDKTVAGFLDEERNIMCVQYHPEASPGPHDSAHLFNDFYTMVEKYHRN